ncbi:MAG: hypothetical protein M3416_20430 [Acidobacteriota bacterium]|nr:hypothetical protein [Acidobacteriota bacterium]
MRKLYRAWLAAALCLSSAAAAARAQAGPPDKPFEQWALKEAEALLTESPWAQTAGSLTGGTLSFNRDVYALPGRFWTVRLRSALPVRRAMLRLRQLREKYDEMSERKRAEFDEKNRPLAECPPCADHYAVSLVPPSGGRIGAPSSLNSMPLARLKLHVRLADEKGERRELVHFTPSKAQGQEVVFFFARYDAEGKPLLTPSSKKLIFTLDPEVLSTNTISRFEFDVSKMIVGGEVAF